ncbi:MAG: SRPBCC family protein [Bacteroides sp.]|nr:SRPBCC family protein [Bacteroides sp.]
MTKFESEVKVIPASQEAVYEKLSDLNNLEKVKDRLSEDKVKNLSFDAESLSVEVPPVGTIVLKIIEKEPCKCIKFETTTSPLPFNLWIQILPIGENECKMKLTIGLEINPFMKAMVQKPLQDGVQKIADMLALINYAQ